MFVEAGAMLKNDIPRQDPLDRVPLELGAEDPPAVRLPPMPEA
jgi:hypothetical protein